jgi:hypothetical protein
LMGYSLVAAVRIFSPFSLFISFANAEIIDVLGPRRYQLSFAMNSLVTFSLNSTYPSTHGYSFHMILQGVIFFRDGVSEGEYSTGNC